MRLFLILILSISFQTHNAQIFISHITEDESKDHNISSQMNCYISDYSTFLKNPVSSEEIHKKHPKYKTNRHFSHRNQRNLKPFGVYMNGGGPALLSISVEYFISSEINLKAGGGWTSTFAGFEYHILGFKNNPWTPYTGFLANYSYNGDFGIYIPFGFHYINKKGFSLGFDIALWVKNTDITEDQTPNKQFEPFGSGSIRIGYHF